MSTFAPFRPASVLTVVALALSATATSAVLTTNAAQAAVGDTFRMTVAPDALTTSDGKKWEGRSGFAKGDFSQSFTSGTIKGAADSRLYYPELVRFDTWSRRVDNGTYRVTLKMREMWWGSAGARVFGVTAEGATKLSDIDIVKAVGKNAAYDRSFDVTVKDGRLDLAFPAKKDSALLSALEVTRIADAPTTPAPTPTTPAPTTSPTPAPTTPETRTVVGRMSVNPHAVKDSAGNTYEAASGFDRGDYSLSYWDGATIKNTKDAELYRPEMVRMNTLTRPVANGTYEVTLKMREGWWTKAGQRVFDVYAEGDKVLADVDIFKAAGKDTAYDRTFRTKVSDGRLDLKWIGKVDSGLLSSLVVTRIGNASTPAPTNPAPTNPAPTTPLYSSAASDWYKRQPKGRAGALSGMYWDSGMYPMNRAGEVTKWEQNRGRKVDVITVFPSRESWNSMQSTWFMDNERIPAGYRGTLDVGVPLWPNDGNLATAKAGGYNAQWERLARNIAAEYPDAYIRLGWEMNLPGWKAAAWANTAEDWKAAYRQAVGAIRKGGPNLRIAWVVNEGAGQTGTPDARVFYPGDAYVDYIGMDAYDWWPGYTTDANIAKHRDGAYGWNFWLDFAKQHGKKFVLPEWGIARANPASGGDNPKYINFVYDWMMKNRDWIAYESYFDETDGYIRSDLFTGYNPKASSEYKRWMSLTGRS
ncbi:malectin domain-containing carbohydrate-binding protein [Mobilicoccus massiliensis]|uniref:malectin domain-containing carbohydrate-binding protein n=1 Tax=Mobilicoccus massiliensis TaxID=1522310 RepID=UPI00058E8839|nr:malectin domain-containing carbohydrate-binding protein [Mobilicoccus massiliensis]